MAHVLREFERAGKLQPNDPRPLEILGMIGRIHHRESQAREAGLDGPSRLAMRQEHTRPLMDQLEKRIPAIRAEADVLPASQPGNACNDAMGTRARDAARRDLPEVSPNDNFDEAFRTMQECACHALPVVDSEGHLIGFLTPENAGEMMMVNSVLPAGASLAWREGQAPP